MLLPYDWRMPTAANRRNWESGPWDAEPDIAAWAMEIQGQVLHCVVLRHPTVGHLCGYVGVSEQHIAYRADTNLEGDFNPEVHGGLTWSDTKNNVRWFGFDCVHAWDRVPNNKIGYVCDGNTYRDLSYVISEVRKLAKQIAEYNPTKETK
jgi:hypothetical protein